MLIKAPLANILVCYMSLFKMIVVVIERLDCIRRNFLWEDNSNKEKSTSCSEVVKRIFWGLRLWKSRA